MKIERINENQIRCTLSSFDLSVRNLNLGELAYGSEKARSLFREMIQKASNEVGFEAEDIPLMVEAIPLSNESVMLVITKIEDPEELDTRFSKFTPMSDDEQDGLNDLAHELLEGADGLLGFLSGDIKEALDEPRPKDTSPAPQAPTPASRIYTFDNLDQVCEVARIVGHVCADKNTLYKKPGSNQYYLVIKTKDSSSLEFSRLCNILAEYGTKVRQEYASEAYYKEHYEIIIKNNALQNLSRI